jgi:chromosome transmission fidelity protein 18
VQVIEFGKTSGDKLVARLKAIAALEGMTIAREALHALVALTDFDVRSCLNTLQFLKSQVAKARSSSSAPGSAAAAAAVSQRMRVTTDMLMHASVGAKDMTKALFDVWGSVFRAPDTRGRHVAGTMSSEQGSSSSSGSGSGSGGPGEQQQLSHVPHGDSAHSGASAARSYRDELYSAAGAFSSEASILLGGLHENLHSSRTNDPTMRHAASALDWLCFGEEVSHRAMARQQFSLLKYFPAAAVGVHCRLSSELRLKVKWPKAESSFRAIKDSRSNVLRSFLIGRGQAGKGSAAMGSMGLGTAAMDMVSPIVSMALCAPLRPVSFTLMNSKEKKLAADIVKVSCRACSCCCSLSLSLSRLT